MAQAGWYDDPTDPGAMRWWDGVAWSTSTQVRPEPVVAVPAGWYERPGRPGVRDWWDGTAWVERDAVEITDLEQIDLDVDLRDIPLDRELGSPRVPHVVHHAAGWYADPLAEADWRWWDGESWTPFTRSTTALV